MTIASNIHVRSWIGRLTTIRVGRSHVTIPVSASIRMGCAEASAIDSTKFPSLLLTSSSTCRSQRLDASGIGVRAVSVSCRCPTAILLMNRGRAQDKLIWSCSVRHLSGPTSVVSFTTCLAMRSSHCGGGGML